MNAADILLCSASRWLLIVLPLGVLLRSAFAWVYTPGPFFWGNLIHAHSHVAYFGWAGLGLMGLMLSVLPRLTGRPVADSAPLRWLIRLAPWAVGGALVTFAWWGYRGPSIAVATLNEVLWILFALLLRREVRQTPSRKWPPALWLMGASVLSLLLSCLGTVLLIVDKAILHDAMPILSQAGLYLFLQAYGDGWLEVGLMGVVAAQAAGGLRERRLAKGMAWAVLLLTAPASLRLLAPFGLTGPLLTAGAVAGVALGLIELAYLWGMRRAVAPAPATPWWLLAAAALVVKAVLEGAALLPGWAPLAGQRNLVIAFLHLKLLLMVSAAMIGALAVRKGAVHRGAFWLFACGGAAMVAALAAQGLLASHNPALIHPLYLAAFWTGLAAALGAGWAVAPTALLSRS